MMTPSVLGFFVPRLGAWASQIVGAVIAAAVTSYLFKPAPAPAPTPAPAPIEARADMKDRTAVAVTASPSPAEPSHRASDMAAASPAPPSGPDVRSPSAADASAEAPLPPVRPKRLANRSAPERQTQSSAGSPSGARSQEASSASAAPTLNAAAAPSLENRPLAASAWRIAGDMVDAVVRIAPGKEAVIRPAGSVIETIGRWARLEP